MTLTTLINQLTRLLQERPEMGNLEAILVSTEINPIYIDDVAIDQLTMGPSNTVTFHGGIIAFASIENINDAMKVDETPSNWFAPADYIKNSVLNNES